MKKIKYTYRGNSVEMDWNEPNEAIAAKEADGGEYEIYDDGQPDTAPELTAEERIKELEEAMDLLLSGVTE